MREIKFRGKTKSGEWVDGSYVYAHKWFGTGEAGHFITSVYGDNRVLVDKNTVGQYTGLKDKNDKEIYDGDIVRFNNQVGEVVFEKGTFGIGFKDRIDWVRLDAKYLSESFADSLCACYNDHYISFVEIFHICDGYDEIEIIGNIYDNPELIKGE